MPCNYYNRTDADRLLIMLVTNVGVDFNFIFFVTQLPRKCDTDGGVMAAWNVCTQKVRVLGFTFFCGRIYGQQSSRDTPIFLIEYVEGRTCRSRIHVLNSHTVCG